MDCWHVVAKHAVARDKNALRQLVALITTKPVWHRLYQQFTQAKPGGLEGHIMSVTMHITITTKDGCFDEFHALAKDELAFTRGSKGCVSIQTSSSKETNTLKFAEVWESENDFNTYFAKRVERSGEDFGRLLTGPPEKECFQTDDWGYGKEWQK